MGSAISNIANDGPNRTLYVSSKAYPLYSPRPPRACHNCGHDSATCRRCPACAADCSNERGRGWWNGWWPPSGPPPPRFYRETRRADDRECHHCGYVCKCCWHVRSWPPSWRWRAPSPPRSGARACRCERSRSRSRPRHRGRNHDHGGRSAEEGEFRGRIGEQDCKVHVQVFGGDENDGRGRYEASLSGGFQKGKRRKPGHSRRRDEYDAEVGAGHPWPQPYRRGGMNGEDEDDEEDGPGWRNPQASWPQPRGMERGMGRPAPGPQQQGGFGGWAARGRQRPDQRTYGGQGSYRGAFGAGDAQQQAEYGWNSDAERGGPRQTRNGNPRPRAGFAGFGNRNGGAFGGRGRRGGRGSGERFDPSYGPRIGSGRLPEEADDDDAEFDSSSADKRQTSQSGRRGQDQFSEAGHGRREWQPQNSPRRPGHEHHQQADMQPKVEDYDEEGDDDAIDEYEEGGYDTPGNVG